MDYHHYMLSCNLKRTVYVQIFEVHNFRGLLTKHFAETIFADWEFWVYGIQKFRELNFCWVLGSTKTVKIIARCAHDQYVVPNHVHGRNTLTQYMVPKHGTMYWVSTKSHGRNLIHSPFGGKICLWFVVVHLVSLVQSEVASPPHVGCQAFDPPLVQPSPELKAVGFRLKFHFRRHRLLARLLAFPYIPRAPWTASPSPVGDGVLPDGGASGSGI